MKTRKIRDGVLWLGAVDWDRRLFDALIPLPDGTSYNAYLVRGTAKTALIDTVDPTMAELLMTRLEEFPVVDYIVHHHAEQDHSGSLPLVAAKYPRARVVCTPACKGMLMDLLRIPEDRFQTVEDGAVIDLGGRTLTFVHTPWVHWPETMCTHLKEEGILFSCDFFGSHLAVSGLYTRDEARVYEAAKRYYAEIMMPFRGIIRKNLEKLAGLRIDLIAPSHGPLHDRPAFIMDAYRDWTSETPKNEAVVAFISMHGSTAKMVERLTAELGAQGVTVHQFNLADTDIGKLAIALVDAATVILGTPTVHVGPHPKVAYAAWLANALRPKAKFASVIGSYGWATKAVEQIAGLSPHLKVEILPPVIARGYPTADDLAALDKLAATIAVKHRELGENRRA